jgi:alpha-tubulin suppressor-like RCC1 family protein
MALYTLNCDSKVSTTARHVVAVTKAGRLFTWGDGLYGCLGHNNSCNELWPKRVKHGKFGELFIVCASAGRYNSATIDSSGLVPIFYFSTILDIATAIYSQSLLTLSFLWTLRYDAIHSMRDLNRKGS